MHLVILVEFALHGRKQQVEKKFTFKNGSLSDALLQQWRVGATLDSGTADSSRARAYMHAWAHSI